LGNFDLLLLLFAATAQVLNVLEEFLDLGISISSSSSMLLCGFSSSSSLMLLCGFSSSSSSLLLREFSSSSSSLLLRGFQRS
jgi:hypothetical protein